MRECGAAVPPSPLPNGRLQYDASGAYLDAIRAALDAASGALLRLMLGQGQLMGWLRSIKHFFLLDQGDLLVHLLEGAQEELSKPASEVSRPRLRSLLELAARTSSVAADPRLDNLKYTFDARGLAQLVVAALAPSSAAGEPVRFSSGWEGGATGALHRACGAAAMGSQCSLSLSLSPDALLLLQIEPHAGAPRSRNAQHHRARLASAAA